MQYRAMTLIWIKKNTTQLLFSQLGSYSFPCMKRIVNIFHTDVMLKRTPADRKHPQQHIATHFGSLCFTLASNNLSGYSNSYLSGLFGFPKYCTE